jgi:hypothetical protein
VAAVALVAAIALFAWSRRGGERHDTSTSAATAATATTASDATTKAAAATPSGAATGPAAAGGPVFHNPVDSDKPPQPAPHLDVPKPVLPENKANATAIVQMRIDILKREIARLDAAGKTAEAAHRRQELAKMQSILERRGVQATPVVE